MYEEVEKKTRDMLYLYLVELNKFINKGINVRNNKKQNNK